MDNLTHGLMGAAVGMLRRRDGGPEHGAPVSHTDKAVVWAAFLAAELPDADVFFGNGPMDEFVYHRGWTHSLAAAPAIALLAALVTKLIWRQARTGTVFAWSLTSVLVAHLVNDWMTGWGTRLLLPFSEVRLGLDWIPIIDLLYTVPLLVAVLLAWRRPALRRKAITGFFLYLLVYTVGYRGLSHTLVSAAVERQYAGQAVVQQRVSPDLFNPLAWRFTVDLGDRYELGSAHVFGAVRANEVLVKTPEDDIIRAVREAPELKPFFDQFSFPYITYRRVDDGYEVTKGDVRYRIAGRGLSYRVLLSQDLKVREVTQP